MSLRANQVGRIKLASLVRPGLAAPSMVPVVLGGSKSQVSIEARGKGFRFVARPGLARPLVQPSDAAKAKEVPAPAQEAKEENGLSGWLFGRRR